MDKAIPIIIAAIVAVAAFISAASVSGGRDYATSSEEQQQQYLENIAKGFKSGFRVGASMGSVQIDAENCAEFLTQAETRRAKPARFSFHPSTAIRLKAIEIHP